MYSKYVRIRVSTGRPVPVCPFVGKKKSLFQCPGTRAGANVPGQTPLSRDVPGQNHFPQRTQKTGKGAS